MSKRFLHSAAAQQTTDSSWVPGKRLENMMWQTRSEPQVALPRVLVVDDDPTFGKIMGHAAEKKRFDLTYCQSIDEFGALKNWDFDVVVMDYDLGAVTGFELTSYLEQFTKEEVPVILVSQTKQFASKRWPSTILQFIHKSLGPYAILEATLEAHKSRQAIKKNGQGKSRSH